MELERDDFFSSVIDAAPDGMLIVDAEGTIVFANRQASELFRIQPDRLRGSSVDDLLPQGLRSGHRAHRLRFRAEPGVRPMGVGLLLRARRGDGTEFPVEISLSPLDTREGFQVLAAVRDVTARVEAEDRMRQILRTLDATDDAMFIMAMPSLRFSYVNDGASRQVGYSGEELVGMTPMHLNPELSEAQWRTAVEPLVAGGQDTVELRTTHRRKDGTDVPIEMSLQAAPPSQDGSVSVIAVARDISSRLATEEQMRINEGALREAEQVLALADDRERIARDLHDTVIQRLFASGLQLEAITSRVDAEVAGRLGGVVQDLDQTIREIRSAIFGLQASGHGERGLRGRILDVVHDATEALGFEPRLQFEGPIETIDKAVAEELLPTLREALTNVTRHAQARLVRVIVERSHDVVLTVVDDGVGVPDDVLGGNGLANMTSRARRLGGQATIERADPKGTRVVWRVPGDAADVADPAQDIAEARAVRLTP